jgi:hypothetical protein
MAGTVSSRPITLETPMSDDKNNAGSPDRDRINVNEDMNCGTGPRRWACPPTNFALRRGVGPTAAAVRKHLGK